MIATKETLTLCFRCNEKEDKKYDTKWQKTKKQNKDVHMFETKQLLDSPQCKSNAIDGAFRPLLWKKITTPRLH